MKTIHLTGEREIPVFAEPEILVIGGGPAGIAAAYCAARRGHQVLLAERSYCLGGTATSGLVGPFMTSSDPDGKNQIIRGFFRELVDRLKAAGGALEPMSLENCDAHTSWHLYGHHNVTPFNPETLKFEAEAMCLEQKVRILYGVQAIEVRKTPDGKCIDGIVFAAKEGCIYICAGMVIDCTGDGDIAYLAGCPMMKGDETDGEMQAAGLFFPWMGSMRPFSRNGIRRLAGNPCVLKRKSRRRSKTAIIQSPAAVWDSTRPMTIHGVPTSRAYRTLTEPNPKI